jgi:hypothetical protein
MCVGNGGGGAYGVDWRNLGATPQRFPERFPEYHARKQLIETRARGFGRRTASRLAIQGLPEDTGRSRADLRIPWLPAIPRAGGGVGLPPTVTDPGGGTDPGSPIVFKPIIPDDRGGGGGGFPIAR